MEKVLQASLFMGVFKPTIFPICENKIVTMMYVTSYAHLFPEVDGNWVSPQLESHKIGGSSEWGRSWDQPCCLGC